MFISSCLQVIAGINNNEIMKGIDKNYHLYFEPVLGATFYIHCHVFIYNINNNNQNRRVIISSCHGILHDYKTTTSAYTS